MLQFILQAQIFLWMADILPSSVQHAEVRNLESVQFHDLKLSRLILGTVQFGMNYGIANKLGQPSYEAARNIIAHAYEGGVTCLDTAAAYGNSEEVLGKALSELGLAEKMVVATKVHHMAPDLTASDADAVVEESVISSLKRLRMESLPICLFHNENNCLAYWESLLKMKDKGYVRNIGASVNSPLKTEQIVKHIKVDAVQMPTSVIDQRFVRLGICEEAVRQNIALFVRSIYLQGLLFVPEDEILPELKEVIPVRRRLQSLANDAGIELAELAVRYVLSISGVAGLVVGVDSVEQMGVNIKLFEKGPLDPGLFRAVSEAVPDLPESILFPGNWSKRVPDAELKSIRSAQ